MNRANGLITNIFVATSMRAVEERTLKELRKRSDRLSGKQERIAKAEAKRKRWAEKLRLAAAKGAIAS
jgi:hypothetical protein